MWNYRRSAKLLLALCYIFLVALAAAVILLPFGVTWYVETNGRDASLPTTIMLTCYPCVPFVATILLSLRKLLSNILAGLVLGDGNLKMLARVSFSCLFVAAITLFSGHLYMPFYLVSIAALFGALLSATIKDMFKAALEMQREEYYQSVRSKYEEDSNISNR